MNKNMFEVARTGICEHDYIAEVFNEVKGGLGGAGGGLRREGARVLSSFV